MNFKMRKIKEFLGQDEVILECGHIVHPDRTPLAGCGTIGIRCYKCGVEGYDSGYLKAEGAAEDLEYAVVDAAV
ncbi:hypothetical protein MCHI_001412 [Candidatus Magnetoovum chiemensis]|nr:hypothetical protein MCHI_001412 [Candidatus Magnetoovum chiemensis]